MHAFVWARKVQKEYAKGRANEPNDAPTPSGPGGAATVRAQPRLAHPSLNR